MTSVKSELMPPKTKACSLLTLILAEYKQTNTGELVEVMVQGLAIIRHNELITVDDLAERFMRVSEEEDFVFKVGRLVLAFFGH